MAAGTTTRFTHCKPGDTKSRVRGYAISSFTAIWASPKRPPTGYLPSSPGPITHRKRAPDGTIMWRATSRRPAPCAIFTKSISRSPICPRSSISKRSASCFRNTHWRSASSHGVAERSGRDPAHGVAHGRRREGRHLRARADARRAGLMQRPAPVSKDSLCPAGCRTLRRVQRAPLGNANLSHRLRRHPQQRPRRAQCAVQPPSIGRMAPVMDAASSLAR